MLAWLLFGSEAPAAIPNSLVTGNFSSTYKNGVQILLSALGGHLQLLASFPHANPALSTALPKLLGGKSARTDRV